MKTIFQHSFSLVQGAAHDFDLMKELLVRELKTRTPVNRGQWQSEDVSASTAHCTYELSNVVMVVSVPTGQGTAQELFSPDLPWTENHFQERVSGEPLNPPPSYKDWPHHSAGERDRFIRENGQFDHTYPERFWPKRAQTMALGTRVPAFYSDTGYPLPAYGIRFDYGDLGDVVELLKKDPFTRQAYLPIWFPEDTGATEGQRVPCTLGYHFIRNGPALDCNYFIRSCDIYRHFTNDVYMAARLVQWMVDHLLETEALVWPGNLCMHISNLHLFRGDAWRFPSA